MPCSCKRETALSFRRHGSDGWPRLPPLRLYTESTRAVEHGIGHTVPPYLHRLPVPVSCSSIDYVQYNARVHSLERLTSPTRITVTASRFDPIRTGGVVTTRYACAGADDSRYERAHGPPPDERWKDHVYVIVNHEVETLEVSDESATASTPTDVLISRVVWTPTLFATLSCARDFDQGHRAGGGIWVQLFNIGVREILPCALGDGFKQL